MTISVYIKPLLDIMSDGAVDESEEILEATSSFYQWGLMEELAQAMVDVNQTQQGNLEQLAVWLSSVGDGKKDVVITLVLPGERIVARQVTYEEKTKRHFASLLPYEIEDDTIEDVESLHFAVGKKQEPLTTIAYVNEDWFADILFSLQHRGIQVQRAVADYQLLLPTDNEIILWYLGDTLWVNDPSGLGFNSSKAMMPFILQDYLSSKDDDQAIHIYSQENLLEELEVLLARVAPSKSAISSRTLPTIDPLELHKAANNGRLLNFCHGDYGIKNTSDSWLKEYGLVIGLGVAAVVAFVAINIFDILRLQKDYRNISQYQEQIVRQVIPKGAITDPVRLLEGKLQSEGNRRNEPSNAVYLLSIFSPVAKTWSVDVASINYSRKDQSMTLSLQANSFNEIEQLRTQITQSGLSAELLSSNAVNDKYQARLRIKGVNP